MTRSFARTVARWHPRLGVTALAATLSIACAPLNPPLVRYDPDAGYRFRTLADAEAPDSDETFIVLTFSGGGTRAAAFAYGVLSELRDTPLGNGRSLLDDVDVISSVSGGSFAAAYYGLFGPSVFFRDFPAQVLHRKIERDLLLRVLAPWNWPRLLSPRFSRTDLADEYYDGQIFNGRRFSDLPRKRPFIILNATDIGRGAQFSFTQEHFDRLCSDLAGVDVSRGVTASSAFPVAFTPITLKNYGPESCGYRAPEWVDLAEHGDFHTAPQRYDLAKTWRSYEDARHRRFVHLSDGGLSDNIGLRAVESAMIFSDSIGMYEKVNNGAVKRFVVIVVDAKPHVPASHERRARSPGIFTVLNAAATNPMENYSSDTVERIRLWFSEWNRAAKNYAARESGCESFVAELCSNSREGACEAQQRVRCREHFQLHEGGLPHPELYLIHVRFEAISDEQAKRKLEGIATRLQLPNDQVDLLVEWARRLLQESGEYEGLVRALRVEPGRP